MKLITRWTKACLILTLMFSLFLVTSCTDDQDKEVLGHMKTLATLDGATVTSLTSSQALAAYGEEEIVQMMDEVYGRLQATDLTYAKVRRTKKEEGKITLSAKQVLTSDLIGEYSRKVTVDFLYDPETQTWGLDWTPDLILEGLQTPDDLVIETLSAKRGTLSDRQGQILAQDQEDGSRVYPLGLAAGPIIGYVRDFNPEYESGDTLPGTPVGRLGLERAYDDLLRPKFGAKVYVKGQEEILAERLPEDGQDIALTLDANVQKAAYETIAGEFGAVAAFHPQTGQALALVSTPSFDPGDWSNEAMDDASYFDYLERGAVPGPGIFAQVYTPGSTQKLPTILAGFKAGTLTLDTGYEIYGSRWQPDNSWGGYTVHRVIPYNGWIDLYRAIVYSDNIFFARVGLDMGYEAFEAGLQALGYDEEVPGALTIEKSMTSEKHDLHRDVALADSAYGQYQVKISPLHLALMYTSMANEGQIMTPLYAMSEDPLPWKQNVASQDHIRYLNQAFQDVIDKNHTIGYRVYARLAGKTGTAETGPDGKTLMGWFVGQDLDHPTMTMAVMINPVNNRGESDVPTSYFSQIFDKLYADGPYTPANLPSASPEGDQNQADKEDQEKKQDQASPKAA